MTISEPREGQKACDSCKKFQRGTNKKSLFSQTRSVLIPALAALALIMVIGLGQSNEDAFATGSVAVDNSIHTTPGDVDITITDAAANTSPIMIEDVDFRFDSYDQDGNLIFNTTTFASETALDTGIFEVTVVYGTAQVEKNGEIIITSLGPTPGSETVLV